MLRTNHCCALLSRCLVYYAFVCLQLSLISNVQAAPLNDQLAAAVALSVSEAAIATTPPPSRIATAADADLPSPPPLHFPVNHANIVVSQQDAPLPPSIFPTNVARVKVIRVGEDTATDGELPPCDNRATEPKAAGKSSPSADVMKWGKHQVDLPPCVFPTDAKRFKIQAPPNAEKIKELLVNLKNKTKAFSKQAVYNPKDDAVRLESTDNDAIEQDPMVFEEQYGSQTNNLMVPQNDELSSPDDAFVLDGPRGDRKPQPLLAGNNEPVARNIMLSASVTITVLGACMLLSLVIWRKYMQKKYGMRRQLLATDDECFDQS